MTILERPVDELTTEQAAAMDREMRATSRQRVTADLTIAGKRGLVIGLIIGVFATVAPVSLSTRTVLYLWAGVTLVIGALQWAIRRRMMFLVEAIVIGALGVVNLVVSVLFVFAPLATMLGAFQLVVAGHVMQRWMAES